MQKIELEIDDFISYCDYKNLSKKKLASYEQTLRLFIRYLKDVENISRLKEKKI
mgnify:CR=1 FL=1